MSVDPTPKGALSSIAGFVFGALVVVLALWLIVRIVEAIWLPVLVIGLVTVAIAAAGLLLHRWLRRW